ncbi:hypothetical protein ACFYUH_24930 [Streptomyces fimicarius]|uniref:hypothetical protein n=1 Tax=Streptomyces griseus TaxID=1911 RepID=UPI00368B14D0
MATTTSDTRTRRAVGRATTTLDISAFSIEEMGIGLRRSLVCTSRTGAAIARRPAGCASAPDATSSAVTARAAQGHHNSTVHRRTDSMVIATMTDRSRTAEHQHARQKAVFVQSTDLHDTANLPPAHGSPYPPAPSCAAVLHGRTEPVSTRGDPGNHAHQQPQAALRAPPTPRATQHRTSSPDRAP